MRARQARRSNRIGRIVSLAEHEERHECQQMLSVRRALDQAVERLAELIGYRNNYEQGAQHSGSIAAARWQDYRRFLARLDQAVATQNRLISDRRQQLDGKERRWRETRRRVEMLEQIRQRYLRAEAARDERRMQKVLDELKPMEQLFDD